MRNFYHYLFFALIGGFAYCFIEILWRGRTHYTMFFAGAIVVSSFLYINENYEMGIFTKCILGMVIITVTELIFGIVFNLILKEHIWDYSNVPLNFLGQICVPFSLIWLVLSGIAFKVIEKIDEIIYI